MIPNKKAKTTPNFDTSDYRWDNFEAMKRIFEEGETIILFDPEKGKEFAYKLKAQEGVNLHKGKISFDQILGKEDGTSVKTSKDALFFAFKPTLRQFIMHMPRDTQIIYPKDIAFILFYGDIFPGAKVLEAGIGSGALTMALLRAVGEKGKVISYEIREEFVKRALENIRQFLGEVKNHEVKLKNVYEGIEEEELDRLILDVPEPWRAVKHAEKALRKGGIFISYLPTIIQAKNLVETLRESKSFTSIEILEVLVRNWQIEGLSVRPYHRMVGHTGFIILARRSEFEKVIEAPSSG